MIIKANTLNKYCNLVISFHMHTAMLAHMTCDV